MLPFPPAPEPETEAPPVPLSERPPFPPFTDVAPNEDAAPFLPWSVLLVPAAPPVPTEILIDPDTATPVWYDTPPPDPPPPLLSPAPPPPPITRTSALVTP